MASVFLQKKGLENAKKYLNKSLFLPQVYRKIEVDDINYIDEEFEEIRKKYKFLFIFVGGITIISYAIKESVLAFRYLDKNDFAFVILGGGDYLNEILSTIKENNISNVFYLGFKKKVLIRNYYLRKADVLVVPCSFEFKVDFSSNKLIDYLEQRKPIITIGYNLHELVNELGFVITDRDPEIIAKKIMEIVNMDSKDINGKIEKGYRYLIQELDYKVAAKKLYSFINSL